jgi:hypothetical protein
LKAKEERVPLPEVFQIIHQVGRCASMVLATWLAMMAAAFLLLWINRKKV